MHGGILHVRGNAAHRNAVAEHQIKPIDMVVVNLYAFEQTAAKQNVEFSELIENIDIGGPSMIRSAAKNCERVTVLADPDDYAAVLAELDESGGQVAAARELLDLASWVQRRFEPEDEDDELTSAVS